MKDYYRILNINKNASQDEIKKAYRKLSKQYHPDVNPQGEEKFKDILREDDKDFLMMYENIEDFLKEFKK